MNDAIPIWKKYNLTVEEASKYSNIGTKKLYSMVNDPTCPFVLKVGNKKLVKRKLFNKFLDSQTDL